MRFLEHDLLHQAGGAGREIKEGPAAAVISAGVASGVSDLPVQPGRPGSFAMYVAGTRDKEGRLPRRSPRVARVRLLPRPHAHAYSAPSLRPGFRRPDWC